MTGGINYTSRVVNNGGQVPAGNTTELQYNLAGILAGATDITYNPTTKTFNVKIAGNPTIQSFPVASVYPYLIFGDGNGVGNGTKFWLDDQNQLIVFNRNINPQQAILFTASAGSTSEGATWYDSTQKSFGIYTKVKQFNESVLYTQTNSVSINNSAAETTLLGTGIGNLGIPANMLTVGKMIRIEMWGSIANTGTPTLQTKIKIGGTTVLDSTAWTMTSITGTQIWQLHAIGTCRSVGATGTVQWVGNFMCNRTISLIHSISMVGSVVTTDTTAANTIDATVQWGTAAGGNAIVCNSVKIEILN